MQGFSQTEAKTKEETNDAHLKKTITECIDQVFKKCKIRGKYVKIAQDKKDQLAGWIKQNPNPKLEDFNNLSNKLNEPIENIKKWYQNHRKTNRESKKNIKNKRILTKEEEEILERAFRSCIKPKPEKYRELSKKVDINSKQIRKWFKYRRRKLKKIAGDKISLAAQIRVKKSNCSESSFKTSNSSPNLSTNDLKSQKNHSSSESNNIKRQEIDQNQLKKTESDTCKADSNDNNVKPMNMQNLSQYSTTFQSHSTSPNMQNVILSYPMMQEMPTQIIGQQYQPMNYQYNNNMAPLILMQNSPYYIVMNPQYPPMYNVNAPNNGRFINELHPDFNYNNVSMQQNEQKYQMNFENQNKNGYFNNNYIYYKNQNPQMNQFQNNQYPQNPNMFQNLNMIQNLQYLQPGQNNFQMKQNFQNNKQNSGVMYGNSCDKIEEKGI